MSKPWDNWIPGVLSKNQMQDLAQLGILSTPNNTIGEASLDLTLTSEAYEMIQGPVKPGFEDRYSVILNNKKLAKRFDAPSNSIFTLNCKHTYIFKLAERLGSKFAEIEIFGQATAKSAVGRGPLRPTALNKR